MKEKKSKKAAHRHQIAKLLKIKIIVLMSKICLALLLSRSSLLAIVAVISRNMHIRLMIVMIILNIFIISKLRSKYFIEYLFGKTVTVVWKIIFDPAHEPLPDIFVKIAEKSDAP